MESESEKKQEEAVVWYRKAYNIASRKGRIDKMVKASQKMGHARRLLVENGTDKMMNLETCIEAVKRLVGSLELGERYRALSKEQREVVIDDIEFVYKDFFDEINMLEGDALFTTVDRFMHAINHGEQIKDKAWSKIRFRCYIHHMMLLVAFIEEEIAKENFKQAFLLLSMLTKSKEEACRLMASQTDVFVDGGAIQELDNCTSLAWGLKFMHLAEEIMEDDKDNSVERAFMALDMLSDAKAKAKAVDMKMFCKAKLYEGKLFKDILKNNERAKACFREVMNICLSLSYTNTMWYNEASVLFQELKKAEVVPETPSEKRKTHMKELESELAQLENADKLNDEKFLDFLFDKFPPKHINNPKKPEGSQTLGVMKKALGKLSAYYHPDRINTEVHGEKYKVLCEEIAKRVNARYTRIKGMN